MKILMVSMPSLHFFRWTEQLKDSGHEVYWFDVVDGGEKVERLNWVSQFIGWKLKWDYTGRHFVKLHFPKIYKFLQKINERNTAKEFEKVLKEIKPDVVHSFALQISCLPIVSVMRKNGDIKWVYSSWGSDIYYYQKLNISKDKVVKILERVNYIITDCIRDFDIIRAHNFKGFFLGVFPGNGGINYPLKKSLISPKNRDTILIKGYNDDIGKGIEIIKSFDDKLIKLISKYNIVIFGIDEEIQDYIKKHELLNKLDISLYYKKKPISNDELLNIMNKSYIYIANSLSDGLPNSLLEAMGMGCFPIQSNPGNVTSEVINHCENGLLIENPLNNEEIRQLISTAINNEIMIENSFIYNVDLIRKRCDRQILKTKIINLYDRIYKDKNKIIFELFQK